MLMQSLHWLNCSNLIRDEGVPKELNRAVELYHSLVVDHEHEEALKRISDLLEEGSEEANGLEANGQQAVELYEKVMEGNLRRKDAW